MLIFLAVAVSLAAYGLSSAHQGWMDESRVKQTTGRVIDEKPAEHAGCKGGGNTDTLVEWTEAGEPTSRWIGTCRSGPDVGDTVDVWVRDDGAVTLTPPKSAATFVWGGAGFFVLLAVFVYFSMRANLSDMRRTDSAAHNPPSSTTPPPTPGDGAV